MQIIPRVPPCCLALALIGILGSSACVNTAARRPASVPLDSLSQAAPTKNDVVCEMERPTGSNIPQRVCYDVRDREFQREQTLDGLRRVRNSDGWEKD